MRFLWALTFSLAQLPWGQVPMLPISTTNILEV